MFFKTVLLIITIFFFMGTNALVPPPIDEINEVTPKQLPNYTFYDLKNKKVFLESFTGNVLVLHFWATWCSSCKHEMSDLDFFQKKVRSKPIIVIPISEDFKGAKIVEDFYKENGLMNLLAFLDKRNDVFSKMNVSGMPTTIIIDSEGNEVARAVGSLDWHDDDLPEYLMQFAQKKPVANADYVRLMNEQFGGVLEKLEPKKITNDSKKIDGNKEISTKKVSEKVNKSKKELPSEIKVSNMQSDNFSLKIKRPVNKTISVQHKKKV